MRVVANSVPKSGTHLLSRLLELLGLEQVGFTGVRARLVTKPYAPIKRLLRNRGPEKVTIGVASPQQIGGRWLRRYLSKVTDGHFITAHCVYTPQLASVFREVGMLVVCIMRDPRDVAVSSMHHIKQRAEHFAHETYASLPSDHERLLLSIRGASSTGDGFCSPLDERYRRFSGWSGDEETVMVRFEDLVGPEGGGSAETRRRAIERVAGHVGLGESVDEGTLREVEGALFGEGRTFRKGQIGGWREEFSEEHVRAAREVTGPLLVELGYEKGLDW